MSQPSEQRAKPWLVAMAIPLLLLAVLLLQNAWVVDDAYISFRAAENLVTGHGLTWNPSERVQVFTNPLWTLLVAGGRALTGELFFTSIGLSLLCGLGAIGATIWTATHGLREQSWKPWLLLAGLAASKAVLDFAGSGLESPLSYLLLALFFGPLLARERSDELTPTELTTSFLLAALAFVNRQDTLLRYAPAFLLLLLRQRTLSWPRRLQVVTLATLPASLWMAFSLVYYGYPFPNTAYAKLLTVGLPWSWRISRGGAYLVDSLRWDMAGWLVLVIVVWWGLRYRHAARRTAVAGALLYAVWAVTSGASATHMGGRFFALPLFVALLVFIHARLGKQLVRTIVAIFLLFALLSPRSALRFGTPAYNPRTQPESRIDTKHSAFERGSALLNWRPGKTMPGDEWYRFGLGLRQRGPLVHLGGAFGGQAVGYAAYAAGPQVHVVDYLGLGDPFLARLPARLPPTMEGWKSGHYPRPIPDGYLESVETGENLVRDPSLRLYYEHIRTITRGPLWSVDRLEVVIGMNLGRWDGLLESAGEPP